MTEQELPTPAAEDDEIGLLDLLQTVVENLRLLVLGPLVAGLLALAYSYTIPPSYIAATRFLPPQQQQGNAASMLQSLGAIGGLTGAATGLKNSNDQYVSFLQSRTLQDALVQRFKLVERYKSEIPEDARMELTGNSTIMAGKDGLIAVTVSDRDPVFAAELANAYVQELTLLLGRMALTEAQQRRLFLERQLQDAKDKLTRAEQALQSSGVSISALKTNPQSAVAGLAQLQASITAQEVKVASMRGYLTESAPDFRQALTELSALRNQLTLTQATQVAGPAGSNEYVAKYRDYKYHETLFDLLAKQYELARVDESREGGVIQVVDAAQAPERKSKPKKAKIAMLATLASGFALLLFVFARQALRNAAQDTHSAEKLVRLRSAWGRALGKRTPPTR